MLTIDCKDVQSIQNDLVVYVSDQVAAIPTLKNHQFVLSMLNDEPVDIEVVILSIKEFLDSIGESQNFAVITYNDLITIKSVTGRSIERNPHIVPYDMFSCAHCGFVTRYEIEYQNHMKIHYV